MSEVRDQLTEWTVCRETTTNKTCSIADYSQIKIRKSILNRGAAHCYLPTSFPLGLACVAYI